MFGAKELLLLVFAMGQVLSRDTDYCYAHNDKPYITFATKTSYHFVHGGKTPYQPIPHCRPVQMWMLIRHSARYPEVAEIMRMRLLANLRDEIIENHEVRGYGRMCDADLNNLRNWRLNPGVTLETAEGPTEEGDEEMNLLGRRTRENFPELFPPVISNVSYADYEFRSPPRGEPMASSKRAFKSGFLDGVSYPDAEIPENDTLFASYVFCPRRIDEVINNLDYKVEVIRFTSGPEYQNLILNVSRRLGFLNNMTVDIVHDIWDTCRYEKSWNITALSPWCAIFSEDELKVLEFREDLADYYKRGYGHEFNRRLGCSSMGHLFRHFEKLESEDYSTEPKGVFTIGGSRSLHFFMGAMGIAKGTTPLLATDFPPTDKHRWRTAEIGTFGSNIAAVFHKCNDTRSPNKVLFYQNEKILSYEGCSNGLCDWEFLKNLFPPVISNVSSSNYKFRLANEGPVISSKTAFTSGVLDRVDIPDAEIPENDTLFSSYRDCPGWHDQVADNAEVQTEVISFAVGPEMQNLIFNVSRRLGFLNNITVDLVVDTWNMCRFDKAWNITALSPWCAIFSEDELKVLEYNETLNDYYTRGPGHELNLRLGCPQMQHLFQHFEKLENGSYSKEPKGVFNVGGSRSLHLFMAAMGFAKDPTPPLASEFRSMNKQRWITSDIGAFASNIAAVFYKCNDTGSPIKVMFYQNEKIVHYEGCNAGLCYWEYLKNKFPNATSECISDFCHQNSSVII